MIWYLLAIGNVITISIANILQRVIMKKQNSDPYVYAIVFQLTCAFVLGIFALVHGIHALPYQKLMWNFVLEAVLYGLGSYFLMSALKHIESSQVTIITSSRSLITIVSAVLFLQERFTMIYALGAAMILMAVILVTEFSTKKAKLNKGVIYAFMAAVLFGLAITNDAYMLRFVNDIYTFSAVEFLLPGLFLLIIRPKSAAAIKEFMSDRSAVKNMLIMSFFYSVANILIYLAINMGGQVSQLGPIEQSSAIVTVMLAILFLKERKNILRKGIAAALVFIGVLLLR